MGGFVTTFIVLLVIGLLVWGFVKTRSGDQTFTDERGRTRCKKCTSAAGNPKVAYVSEIVAERASDMAKRYGNDFRVYKGTRCKYWHLTSQGLC